MSERDDRMAHDEKADELERELDELQEQHDNLGEKIEDAGDEWERRKADERVPGATGEPSEDDDDGEDLDFGRSLGEGEGS